MSRRLELLENVTVLSHDAQIPGGCLGFRCLFRDADICWLRKQQEAPRHRETTPGSRLGVQARRFDEGSFDESQVAHRGNPDVAACPRVPERLVFVAWLLTVIRLDRVQPAARLSNGVHWTAITRQRFGSQPNPLSSYSATTVEEVRRSPMPTRTEGSPARTSHSSQL